MACSTQIVLFHNFIRIGVYILTDYERVQNFLFIEGVPGVPMYYVSVDTEKTYIIDDNLNQLAQLEHACARIIKCDNHYYCHNKKSGSVDIYSVDTWTRISELKLATLTPIIGIHKHYRFALIDYNRKYYYVHNGSLTTIPPNTTLELSMSNDEHIAQYNVDENLLTSFASCYHEDNCNCKCKYTYVIFEGSITIFDELNSLQLVHIFDFNNFVQVRNFNQNKILLVDHDGIITTHKYL